MPDSHNNFLNLPAALSDPARARYAIIPIPYEGTVSYKAGTVGGPAAIIDASKQVEKLDEELLREITAPGIATYPAVKAARDPLAQMKRIAAAVGPIVAAGQFPLALGGEHSISVPIIEAVARHHGPISVLQIDAHADLRDVYSGTKHSHGAVMRRVLEITGSICQVGIRSFSQEELEQCRPQVDRFITPAYIQSHPRWTQRVLRMLGPKVYITVDIDGLDPALAPGTGTPEPGGLTWEQVTLLLRQVCAKRQVVGADIVEVRPIPPNHITEYLAARLACKIIAYTQ